MQRTPRSLSGQGLAARLYYEGMLSEEVIRAERAKIIPLANAPEFREQQLAQNLVHTLTWILNDVRTMPPSELFGYVSCRLEDLAARLDGAPTAENVLKAMDAMYDEQSKEREPGKWMG